MEIVDKNFKLVSKYKPKGDQPKAIEGLVRGIKDGKNMQTLLGVTGSGKTFTMANVISKVNKPTLIIAHNKTLAAQLYEEMREFFPENRVEYFISYYDYYQPESYLPVKDQYIEKDSAINPRIEQMRHATTASLLSRSDVIVVASVSCIYGLSDPATYKMMGVDLEVGKRFGRKEFIEKLVAMTFERNDLDLASGRFRVKGDVIDLVPGYSNNIIRVEFFGDEVDRISEIDKNTGEVLENMKYFYVWPATNYVIPESEFERALEDIKVQLKEDLEGIDDELIKHRLKQRTVFDMEMLKETGTCKGVENYSRHFDNRKEGEKAFCLLDYFPRGDFLIMIDESHRTIPQVGGMFNGDRARKKNLIDYGFRLTSAYDNRPLRFREFEEYMRDNNVVFVSATPGDYEEDKSGNIVEQIIRPTGLVDPVVEIRPISSDEEMNGIRKGDNKKKNGTRMNMDEDGVGISNVVIVHGSNDNKEEAEELPLENERHWKSWLKEKLEKRGIEVSNELYPEDWNPNYERWKVIFEKNKIDENSILVGHSAGCSFLVRWLGETKRKVKKLILVAPAKIEDEKEIYNFEIDKTIKKNIEKIVLIQSNNDNKEILESCKEFARELGVNPIVLRGRGHFIKSHMKTKEFPELLEEILTTNFTNLHEYGGQIRDVLDEIRKTIKDGNRVLLTTLTKRMAEELTDFLAENDIKTRYLHSEIDAFERTEIIRELRVGTFDVLVGINLLREGIDIPEVGFVGVLDADKEGFLRDERSLIQIIGRAARNDRARVVLYADNITGSIRAAVRETERRRKLQMDYNLRNNIIPQTVVKPIREKQIEVRDTKHIPKADIPNLIIQLEAQMKEAAELLDFESAISYRTKIKELEKALARK